MRDIGFVHGIHHARRFDVATFGGSTAVTDVHFLAALAPDVALENVMIIRQTKRWRIAHHFAESPAVLIKFAQVIEDRQLSRFTDETEAAVVLINLIA